ncbi:MAG: hypothetical protein J6J73_00645, partial [Agathobacter sp.]|nr:hypothetical protein [Agathobacter sp.]
MKRFLICIMTLVLVVLCTGCTSHDVSNQNIEDKQQVSESTEVSETMETEPSDDDMVLILDYIPDMVIDLK